MTAPSQYTNMEIMIANGYNPSNTFTEQLSSSIDDVIAIYDQLFASACTLAAFQFIGLVFDKTVIDGNFTVSSFAYFFFGLGFIVSLFSAIMTFITSTFFKTLRFENRDFIETSIQKYKTVFYFGYITFFINSICFMVPINIILHELIYYPFAIAINIASLITVILGIIFYILIVHNKQVYTINNREIKRNVYI
jgi:hypothetical protein